MIIAPRSLTSVVLGVVTALGLAACSKPTPSATRATPGTVAISDELMVSLALAKNHHHKANIMVADGNVDLAIEEVRKILTLQFPPNAPEAIDVVQDAQALLAKLLASRDRIDEGLRIIDDALASATRESFFVANLYTVKGELHELRSNTLDGQGPDQVAAERRAAIAALDKSNEINERILAELRAAPATGTP